MKHSYNKILRLVVAFCLICVVLTPTVASAAVKPPMDPQASNYIAGYYGYIARSGNTIQPVFSIAGTYVMDRIGATEIYLYESSDGINYSLVKSYRYTNYSNMMAYNESAHASYMTYTGNANYYYKAYICVYAGRNGGGDSRYFWAY